MSEQLVTSDLNGGSQEVILTEQFLVECILLAYPYIYYSTPMKQ